MSFSGKTYMGLEKDSNSIIRMNIFRKVEL